MVNPNRAIAVKLPFSFKALNNLLLCSDSRYAIDLLRWYYVTVKAAAVAVASLELHTDSLTHMHTHTHLMTPIVPITRQNGWLSLLCWHWLLQCQYVFTACWCCEQIDFLYSQAFCTIFSKEKAEKENRKAGIAASLLLLEREGSLLIEWQ